MIHNKLNKIILILYLTFCAQHLRAQNSSTGNWLIYIGNQKINTKWNWHNEIQYRNYNFIGDMQQVLLRTGIGYNLSENNNNLLLGYAFIHSQNYKDEQKKVSSLEHRIFLQFITRQSFDRYYILHRYRLEERFLQDDFQLRWRYYLGIQIPFNHKTLTHNTVYASLYNEVFLSTSAPIFDRNRLYGALGYVYKDFRIELGFMAQTLEAKNRNQFQIAFYNNFSLNKN